MITMSTRINPCVCRGHSEGNEGLLIPCCPQAYINVISKEHEVMRLSCMLDESYEHDI